MVSDTDAQEDIGRPEDDAEEEEYAENRFRFGKPRVMYCAPMLTCIAEASTFSWHEHVVPSIEYRWRFVQ